MDKLRFAVRFTGRTIMPKSLKPLRIGRLRKEFLLCRNIRWKSIGVVWRIVIDLNIHGLFVLGSFATRWLLPLGKVPPLSPAKSAFLFPSDPFAYVGRATAQLDALCLTGAEESDHVDVHQRHFVHPQHDAASRRFDLGFQLWKTLGIQGLPDTGERRLKGLNEGGQPTDLVSDGREDR